LSLLNLRMGVRRWQAEQTSRLLRLRLLCDVRTNGGRSERQRLSNCNAAQVSV
jgi:hypothetical protein